MGIAWFLCRLSNNILQYGRWRPVVFGWICVSFTIVIIVFWSACPVNTFISETMQQTDRLHLCMHLFGLLTEAYHRCRWNLQVIVPSIFNVVADLILFVYPFPIIFMANIPRSLRYSLLGVFALCGLVTASSIVRVVITLAGGFLSKANIYQ